MLVAALPTPGASQLPGTPPGVTLALSSYRHHVGYPRIYVYRHDGVGSGRIEDGPPPATDRSDFDPFLTADGALLAFNVEAVGKEARLMLWDVNGKQSVPLPPSPATAVDMAPCLTADGKRLLFATLFRPGPSGWNLLLMDREDGKPHELPGLNSDEDDRMPSLSGDGRWLAFASSRPDGAGLQDLYLYDTLEKHPVPLPGLNSASRETEPCISADGRWLAFVSTRPRDPGAPAGSGDLDVHLYDRSTGALVPLPGLNGPGAEQSPALSPDGRYLAFVSELGKLLPTPGLNSPRDDMEPALAAGTVKASLQ
ncbi:MAG: WD40-like beta propeller repeat protein [Armatimonadetes bacterium]|nr:WD40-like beta propeller repeat protein [Armatimonadota bacterium]